MDPSDEPVLRTGPTGLTGTGTMIIDPTATTTRLAGFTGPRLMVTGSTYLEQLIKLELEPMVLLVQDTLALVFVVTEPWLRVLLKPEPQPVVFLVLAHGLGEPRLTGGNINRPRCRTKKAPSPAGSMSTALESYINRTVAIVTSDGRMIVGTLKGFDQTINLILDESHERVFSSSQGVEQVVLGLYIVRGDNVAVIGEIDEETDSSLDLGNIRAEPLNSVVH
ncbi:hypothetical protein PAMA_013452 [Pampus argenteus]